MPVAPQNTNPLWSADGQNAWTADGFYGWSADGYQPTTLQAAVTALAIRGINVGLITYVYSATVPEGFVITGWEPLLSSTPGSYVPLTVSLGPAPIPTLVTVPNVVGKFYYDAQLAILQAGLFIAPPTWVLSTTVNPQYVISQSLTAGIQVTPQTLLSIVVSGFSVLQQPGIPTPVP